MKNYNEKHHFASMIVSLKTKLINKIKQLGIDLLLIALFNYAYSI